MGLASITNNIITDTSIPSANVITGTLASGQVAYGSAANTIAGSANLFWDSATSRLGINTNTPVQALDVRGIVSINTNGQATTISTYRLLGTDGNNIWIGGGGTASTGTASQGSYNTGVGVNALSANTTGSFNNAIGFGALTSNTTGNNNNSIGWNALSFNTTGTSNTAFGHFALRTNSTGSSNVAMGESSLRLMTTGNNNVAVGASAMYSANGAQTSNVAVGATSLYNNGGNQNTAIGMESGMGAAPYTNGNTSGGNNIFIGFQSVGESATASNRTFIGNTSTTSTWLGGNLLLGTRTDGGQRLQVIGDTLLNGVTTLRGTTNNDTTTIFRIEQANQNGRFLVNAAAQVQIVGDPYTLSDVLLSIGRNSFNPTSGNTTHTSLSINTTINQVGATGITRGIYVNPTLTAAADFRAIEWSNNAATAPAVSWGLYGAGTAPNYMAGSLGIGNTSFAGMNLRVSKSITGSATGRSVYLSGDFQSDVSVGYGVQTSFGTQAATFTLSDLIYFQAAQGTKGAGSTIGTQVGFDVASMTNGSTNIAFRGQNASASNVWNLYMNGTAANYLNGSLLIGSATDDGINKLQVTGSILATTNSTISGLSVGKGAGNVATNTALGASALITNSTGVQNTAVGNEALRLNTTGLQNSAFGYRASRATTTGSTNSAFGIDALRVNTTGNNNAAFGAQALDNNTAGNNTAIGTNALLDNTSGVGNTALGYRAGYAGIATANFTGSNNIFIGSDSIGESASDSNRTFIGNTSTTSTWLGGRLLLGARTDDATNRLQVTGNSALVGVAYVNTNASIGGYGHSLQVLANASGGMIVSTTNTASGIGIVNSSSANKTWDISPFNNDLAINESGSGSRMYFLSGGNITVGGITNSGNLFEILGTFRTTGVNTLSNLQGTGSRMVVADANGVLSTQAIPGGSITGTGAFGQVTYWTGASSQAGNAGFTFSPGNKLFLNNTVIAATNVARGFHITSQLSSFANNEDLVGIDLSPVYTTSGLPTGVHAIGIRTASSFTPTQTDIRYTAFSIQPSINQGGTATGITRGIHINPTLTAVVDWRSVEWSNNTGWGIYGTGVAPNQMNGRLTVSATIPQTGTNAFSTFANRIGLFGAQSIDVPTTATFSQGTVTAAGTSAQYLTFNGNTTVGGDSLLAGSVHINSVQFATTGTVTMADSATNSPRTMSVMQLQMQKAGVVGGTINRGSTLYLFGVYPTTSTGGTVTFTEYAGLRIGNLTEWTGGTPPNTTVALTNRWGIYQEGDTDPNYFAGSVGVGVATNNASAKLQVDSTTQGFLPPRMTNVQMNAIATPAAGLIVYNTTDNKHYGYNGTTWNAFY